MQLLVPLDELRSTSTKDYSEALLLKNTAAPAPEEPPPSDLGTLQIHMKRAKGLKSSDMFGGASDPFVELVVGDDGEKKKTKTIDDNNNPEWDELLEFERPLSSLVGQSLSLRVLDSDMLGAERLGEVRNNRASSPSL